MTVASLPRVSHGYFAVDWDPIWATLQNDLPPLEANHRTAGHVGRRPARLKRRWETWPGRRHSGNSPRVAAQAHTATNP